MSKFGLEEARIGVSPWILRCPPPVRRKASMGDAWRGRGCHARVRPPPPLLLAQSPPPTPGCRRGETPQRLPHPSPPPARSLHPSASQSGATMAAGAQLYFRPAPPSPMETLLCCPRHGRHRLTLLDRARKRTNRRLPSALACHGHSSAPCRRSRGR